MQYRNTPDAEYNLSPSQLVFGRPIRDFLPIQPGQFTPSDVWVNNRETRELALRNRVIKSSERWSSGTKDLPPLIPGSQVMIQNQHGAGKKWDKTGLVLENMGYNKYCIKVDGSGHVTDRNRQFLCQFTPVTPQLPSPCLDISSFENPVVEPNHQPAVEHNHQPVDEPNYQPVEQQPLPTQTMPETLAPNTPTQVVP